jgi:hypothetical protein
MAANNNRRAITGYDLQNIFAAYIEASAKDACMAENCIALRQAGKAAQAKNAENEAKR